MGKHQHYNLRQYVANNIETNRNHAEIASCCQIFKKV